MDQDQALGSFSNFQEEIIASSASDETILLDDYHKSQAQTLISCRNHLYLWGWSDPYTSLFLEFWKYQIPNAKFILIYDSPWSILNRYYEEFEAVFDENLNKFIELWSQYNQVISSFCAMYPQDCLLAKFDSVYNEPEAYLQEIKTRFTSPINESLISTELINQFKNEISEEYRLRHLITHRYPEAIALYETLNQQAWTTHDQYETDKKSKIADHSSLQWTIQDWLHVKKLNMEMQEANQLIKTLKNKLRLYVCQLHKTQENLQNIQRNNQEKDWIIRRFKFQQSVAQDPDACYQCLVWEAWAAYCQGDFFEMASRLQKSQRYSDFSKTEFIIDWLNRFLQLSICHGESFNSEDLTNLPEWQNLVCRIVVNSNSF
ncbi:hypothetical protein AY600_06620 [Phormidium willei BDU 130791]|nr:hypothetical protein AY600_06620 [Phormidium willei BDU 130791]